MDSEYVDVLQKKLEILKAEKDQKARDIKDLLNNIGIIQKSIDSIVQLLEIEGVGFNEQFLKDVRRVSISDIAYDYLHASTEKSHCITWIYSMDYWQLVNQYQERTHQQIY
jgi:hypothetical protein